MKIPGTYTTRSPEETHRLAAELADLLEPGAVLALHGDLGAGKTCFIQGLARALGVRGAVSSPTFTLVNEHEGRRRLHHIDLYRIDSPEEALAMGLDDYLYSAGVTAIEWAERVGPLLPKNTYHIRLTPGEDADERTITISRGES